MGQENLPLFPLDSNLLPGARKRVQLALKLDEQLRSSSKKSAEKSWEQQMAEAAGIILSDDEEDEETRNKKSQTGGPNASALQQVINLLSAIQYVPREPADTTFRGLQQSGNEAHLSEEYEWTV